MNRAIERAEHQLTQKSAMLADYCGLNPRIGAAPACRDGLIIKFLQLQVTVTRIIATTTNEYGSRLGAMLIIKGEWVIYDQPNSHYQRWTSYPRTAHPIYVFQ